jgi:hypothetical protein
MDAIARAGANGLMDPVEPVPPSIFCTNSADIHFRAILQGLACGSDTAHMSMFGYDPRTHYRSPTRCSQLLQRNARCFERALPTVVLFCFIMHAS